MKKNKPLRQTLDLEIDEREEQDEELDEKVKKKIKQKEGIERRKSAKNKDKVARWGGLILLGLVMFVGFLLWVSGEMKKDPGATPSKPRQTQYGSSVIVK